MIRNAIQIVGDLGRVDDDVDCRGEGEEEMAQLDDDLAPQWLCGHLAIAQHVVRLIQVDEGLGGVADHQHHHHPCEEGHHDTIPPAVCCMTGYCIGGSASPFHSGYAVVPPSGCGHGPHHLHVEEGEEEDG